MKHVIYQETTINPPCQLWSVREPDDTLGIFDAIITTDAKIFTVEDEICENSELLLSTIKVMMEKKQYIDLKDL